MNKYLLIVSALLIQTGCATPQNIDLGNTPIEDVVTLVSQCDSECEDHIEDKYQVKTSFDFGGGGYDVVSYVILSEINGIRGIETYYDPAGSYNNYLDGQFVLKTSPGQIKLLMTPTSVVVAPFQTREVVFEAKPSRTYLVAQLHTWKKYRDLQVNKWSPLLVDVDSLEIIFPKGEPEWSQYCFLSAEFGRYRPCPSELD